MVGKGRDGPFSPEIIDPVVEKPIGGRQYFCQPEDRGSSAKRRKCRLRLRLQFPVYCDRTWRTACLHVGGHASRRLRWLTIEQPLSRPPPSGGPAERPVTLTWRASDSFVRHAAKPVMAAQKKATSPSGNCTSLASKDARSNCTALLSRCGAPGVEQKETSRPSAIASVLRMALSPPMMMDFIVQGCFLQRSIGTSMPKNSSELAGYRTNFPGRS